MRKTRGVLIAGNWKMNHGLKETEAYFQELKAKAPAVLGAGHALGSRYQEAFKNGGLQACLAPPALSLAKATAMASDLDFPITIAAQNASWEKKGAFTGELSGPMLQEIGISWVIVGHSERRQLFGETDQTVKMRAESLLQQGFRVILCVGETRAERESGATQDVLFRQLNAAIPAVDAAIAGFLDGRLIIAYEPVWAIGTGLTATPEQAEEAHALIRGFLRDRFGVGAADRTSLLYGGSVTPANIASLLNCPNVDGALVGGG